MNSFDFKVKIFTTFSSLVKAIKYLNYKALIV